MFKKKEKAPKKKKIKGTKKQKELLRQYEQGKILQVDNRVNNKEYFKSIEDKKDV